MGLWPTSRIIQGTTDFFSHEQPQASLSVDGKNWTFWQDFVLEGSPTKKSRFTESQIVAILREGEAGVAVAQLTRKDGISAATYYHWKSKYAGAGIPELKRLPELEAGEREAKADVCRS